MADDPALEKPSSEACGSGRPDVLTQLRSAVSGLSRAERRELGWLGAVGLAFALAFAPQCLWMGHWWMKSEYYGHGIFIPLISAYIIYRQREALSRLAPGRDRVGLALMVAGLLLHLVAVAVDVNFASLFAAIIVLGGFIAWAWGRPVALALLFPIAYLGFMVPVDRLLIDMFASPLQLFSAKMAAGFGAGIGMPVVREGVNISVPGYTFEVAIPCSGIKSLISMFALATLYAYALRGTLWQRALVVGAALPVALLANATRVTTVLLMAQSMGARAAEGFFHGFSGVLVFAVGLLALYGVGRLVGCRTLRDDI